MYTAVEEVLGLVFSHRYATSETQTQGLISCMTPRVMRQKSMVASSTGSGTEIDCAGKGQQKFILPNEYQESSWEYRATGVWADLTTICELNV
jgi:hypothetical protein